MSIDVLQDAGRIDLCQYMGMARTHLQTIGDCCSPVADTVMSAEEAAVTAGMFRLLADPTRLRLLSLVAAAPSGETCVCDLPAALGVSQPTVSHHLKALHSAGLVEREQRGRWAWYRVRRDALRELGSVLV
jgi:ArsR family transcriptional regulator